MRKKSWIFTTKAAESSPAVVAVEITWGVAVDITCSISVAIGWTEAVVSTRETKTTRIAEILEKTQYFSSGKNI